MHSRDAILALVGHELSAIPEEPRREALRMLLIEPVLQHRDWDFGPPGARYPTWLLARAPGQRIALAYAELGPGPQTPWGSVSVNHLSLGGDAQWYAHLDEAFLASGLYRAESPSDGGSPLGPKGRRFAEAADV